MNFLFALLLPLQMLQPQPNANACELPLPPAGVQSFMVSEDYAEINWQAVQGAKAYQIEIRKIGPDGAGALVLEDKTVWLSFYFRVADPAGRYEYRLASVEDGVRGDWTAWMGLNAAENYPIVQRQ